MQSDLIPIPPYLLAHPTEFPGEPPIVTRVQSLPMSELSWENFERLCLRIVRLDAELETCRVYGTPGQSQEGIDIYAVERSSGKHRVLQCKRVEQFAPSTLSAAVDLFLSGTWASTARRFTICTTFRLESTKLTGEIEKQREKLRAAGIEFEVWDAAELDMLLKDQSEVVDDFFGRTWVQVFCPPEGLNRLLNRTTGPTVAEMRAKLGALYTRVFVAHDPGLPVDLGSRVPVPLRDRYVIPDVYEDRVDSRALSAEPPRAATSQAPAAQTSNLPIATIQTVAQTIDLPKQRRRLNDWLSDHARQVLLGGPGLGKSAFLRYVTLDLLSQNPVLTQASSFHDTYLPVWLSFPFWTAKIDQSTAALSIPDIIQAWLHLWSEDRLWPLFEKALNDERLLLMVDGLDEYRSEDTGRNALVQLQVFAEQRNCRVIATARPAGYERLGVQRTGWSATYLAELTLAQQEQYALRWFTHQRQLLGQTGEQEAQDRTVDLAVASFMAEMRSSADLSELAKTPLLLGLLLYLKGSSIPLPNSRYRAYGRLVEHLISVHPIARRRAAMVKAEDSDLTPEDARTVFAYLAFHLQSQLPEGLIERREAEEVISQFLRDDELGFGLSQAEARRQAHTLLAFGEDSLGLLVERGPQELGFLHRSFQEYLAAEHIARRPFAAQSNFVKQHCIEPTWQEVLLSLLHLTKRPEEVGELVAVISDTASLISDRFITLPILCEVAVGDFQCQATLARKICRDIIAEIEESPWLHHRERLLRSLLIGLFSPRVRDLIQERLRTWVPGRPWRHPVVSALARGSDSDEIVNCLLRLIIDEDDSINAQAATTLSSFAPARPEIANRLIDLLGRAYPVQTQVAALEALLIGWSDHEEWPRILSEIENSPGMEIRMIAIRRKIKIGTQTIADRDQLLSWARRGVGLRLLYGGSLAGILLEGWPGDEVVKRKALEAIHPNSWDDQYLDHQIAFQVLVQGFADDQDAHKAIASLIKAPRQDYLWMQHGSSTFERLKGISSIVEAVDEWLTNHDAVLTREISNFVRIGWTQVGKQRLLEGLAQSFPFWCVEALLEHWGLEDQEVSSALAELANSPRAAEIGHLLPRIISEPEVCRQRLVSFLEDPKCRRPDLVLEGLARLGNTPNRDELVSMAMPFTERDTLWDTMVKDVLFAHFSDCREVKDLAKRQLSIHGGNLAGVVQFFGNDHDLLEGVLATLNPLPVALRSKIITFLCDHRVSLPWVYDLFAFYDLEADPGIKTQMAIAHYRHLVESGGDIASSQERLLHEIVVGGADNAERRQAAYCGLHVLGALSRILTTSGIYHPGPPHIGLYNALTTNYPLIQHLLANWGEIRGALGDGFWASISDFNRDRLSVWGTLCLLADNYPAPRAEALEFIRGAREVAIRPQILDFVARVQPRSTLLRDLCLNSLFSGSNASENDPEKAIELLARDFPGDSVVRDALEARLRRDFHMHGHRAMWALCELGPDDSILAEEMERLRPHLFKGGEWFIQTSFDMAIVCAKGTSREVLSIIQFVLRGCRPNYRYFAKGFQRPIVRRVTTDPDLQAMLMDELQRTQNPSERGSFLSLLATVSGITPELRDLCRTTCEPEADKLVASAGMDLITGLVQPVREFAATCLLEALGD